MNYSDLNEHDKIATSEITSCATDLYHCHTRIKNKGFSWAKECRTRLLKIANNTDVSDRFREKAKEAALRWDNALSWYD